MDCCNYMSYRHHQPYYGSQYFPENFPTYHGEFYGQHLYHDYYGASPYYAPQHWQGFMPSDYVYNPKEARIRKAMRDATRERTIGASPMLPRPNARRPPPHPWMTSHEDQLMMSPLGAGLRGPPAPGLESPCFPTGNAPEQYMSHLMSTPTPSYSSSKLESSLPQSPAQVLSRASGPVHHPGGYMQPNPLAQLQQQTEMWNGFQDDIRPRSSGTPYMLQDVAPPHHYHHQPSPPLSIPSPMMLDKHRQTPHPMMPLKNTSPMPLNNASPMPLTPPHCNANMPLTPPHSNENVPPDETIQSQTILDKIISEECDLEPKHQLMEAGIQPLMENNNLQQQAVSQEQILQQNGEYVPVYPHELSIQEREFDKAQDVKIKKTPNPCASSCRSCSKFHKNANTLFLPLSCMNYCGSPDLFTNNIEYQRRYIARYFQNSHDYDVFNFVTDDGDTFPYATLSNFMNRDILLNDLPQPNFVKTDVGYIPIVFDYCPNIMNVYKTKAQNLIKKK